MNNRGNKMMLAEIGTHELVPIISSLGTFVLLPIVSVYLKYKLDEIAAKQKDIAHATGAVPNAATVVDTLKEVVKEQRDVKVALVSQTEKSEVRDEIIRDVQQKVNGPHHAELRRIWNLLEEKAKQTGKIEDKTIAAEAEKAYTDSINTSSNK